MDTWQEMTSWNMVCHRNMTTQDGTDWGLQALTVLWDEYLLGVFVWSQLQAVPSYVSRPKKGE
jgi:hypothetical protein